jgi:hypothetical protein
MGGDEILGYEVVCFRDFADFSLSTHGSGLMI